MACVRICDRTSTCGIYEFLSLVESIAHYNPLLTLPMLMLRSTKAQDCKDFWKPLKPCHVGWPSLSALCWVSLLQGFKQFPAFLHHFVLVKLATSSIRVKRARSVQLMLYGEHYTYISPRVYCQRVPAPGAGLVESWVWRTLNPAPGDDCFIPAKVLYRSLYKVKEIGKWIWKIACLH